MFSKPNPNKFHDIEIVGDQIISKDDSGPLVGATARIENAGDIQRRVTVSRVLLTGGVGLFLKKKVDNRELYLTIEGDGYSIVRALDPKKDGTTSREFAARVNSLGRTRTVA